MGKKIQTDFLFAQPSFAAGVAGVFDMWGQLTEYNASDTPSDADAKAIFADWCVVGQDLQAVIDGSSLPATSESFDEAKG